MIKSLHSKFSPILRDHLRNLRESAGMTQRDLAAALEIDHGTVAKIETGERRMDVIEYFQIVTVLGRDPGNEAAALMESFKSVKVEKYGGDCGQS